MDEEQEEILLHITAHYVEEVKGGRQPRVSEYIARHPQYADEIADFVAYYHTFEVQLATETDMLPELAEEFHIAINSAYNTVDRPEHRVAQQLTTLLVTREGKLISLAHLAQAVQVSIDIVTKLEQRKIKASSIPQVLLNRLAGALQQPQDVIRAYFEGDYHSIQSKVAETKMPYGVAEPADEHIQSFRQVIEESSQESEEQKRAWYEVLNMEGL